MRAVLFASLLAVACDAEPVRVSQTTNAEVPVALLFEHDGCKVYRFEDSGRNHYYVRCPKEATQTIGSHEEPCGKGCMHTVDEGITTEQR